MYQLFMKESPLRGNILEFMIPLCSSEQLSIAHWFSFKGEDEGDTVVQEGDTMLWSDDTYCTLLSSFTAFHLFSTMSLNSA